MNIGSKPQDTTGCTADVDPIKEVNNNFELISDNNQTDLLDIDESVVGSNGKIDTTIPTGVELKVIQGELVN